MKINVEEINASQKRIEITIPAKEVKKRLEDNFRKAMQTASVRGFRPGKAPKNIIEKYYGDAVRSQVSAELMEEQSKKALEKEKINTVVSPVVEPGVLETGKDFSFAINVEVLPEVELKEYKGIEVERDKAKVTDEDVEKAVEDMRKRNAELKRPEHPRPAQNGDVVLLDMKALSKGVDISHEENFQVEIGAGMMPEEFEQALVGVSVGDHKEVDVSYPEEDNHALSGQEVHFDFTVKDVQEKILSALDDEFAKDVGRESLDDLRSFLEKRILEARQEAIDRNARNEIMKQLRETHPLDLPPSLVTEQRKTLAEELKRQFQMSGLPFVESQFNKELSEKATEKVHDDLLLGAIAEKEKIEPADEEINNRIREMAEARGQNYEKLKDALEAGQGMKVIRFQLKNARTLDFLLDNANIIEGKPAKKSASKPPAKDRKKTPAGKKQDK